MMDEGRRLTLPPAHGRASERASAWSNGKHTQLVVNIITVFFSNSNPIKFICLKCIRQSVSHPTSTLTVFQMHQQSSGTALQLKRSVTLAI